MNIELSYEELDTLRCLLGAHKRSLCKDDPTLYDDPFFIGDQLKIVTSIEKKFDFPVA